MNETEGYDKVVTRFTNLDSVRQNLDKIANYLHKKLAETRSSQLVLSNNFCTYGSQVHPDVNVQFDIVKMLVRALDIQAVQDNAQDETQNYTNRVLDEYLKNPKSAFKLWKELQSSTIQTEEQQHEFTVVNALLISCGVVLAENVVRQTYSALQSRAQNLLNSQLIIMQGRANYQVIKDDVMYLAAAQLASDAWVACNQGESNLAHALTRVMNILQPSGVAEDDEREEETKSTPVVPLRSSSIADQRMMHQIFGTMRANRLRHKHSPRQRERQSGGRRSRRSRNTRSRTMSNTRPRSLSRTVQRPRSRSRYLSRTNQRPRSRSRFRFRSRSRHRFVQRRSVVDTRRSRQ